MVQGALSVHVPLRKCDEWLEKEGTQKCPEAQGEEYWGESGGQKWERVDEDNLIQKASHSGAQFLLELVYIFLI